MKTLFFLFAMCFINSVFSQDLIFDINQYGVSYKNSSTNQFDEAEIKSSQMVITLQDKVVKVIDEFTHTISLEKMNGQNNNIKHLYTQIWKAFDANKSPVQFKFTVNVETKDAMVEVGYKDFRNYYFGKFSYGNLENLSKEVAQTFDSNQ